MAIGCWFLPIAFAAAAQPPRLQTVFPLGGQAGQVVEVSVGGDELAEAERLIFSHPGITAAPVMRPPDRFYPEPRPVGGRFTVKIEADVPPAIYEARVAGPMGVTNARRWVVSTGAELREQEPNNEPSQAGDIALGTTINGHCDARGFDCFRFTAAAGQRLAIQCVSRRLNSRARAAMLLFDSAGRELAGSRATLAGDAVIDFTAPGDGQFVVKVFDSVYGGGDAYAYRLRIEAGPWDDALDPAGPASLPGGSVHPAPSPEQALTPEQEPNDSPAQAQRIYPPCEITGAFHPRDDLDWMIFEAAKGQRLAIELVSQRLGAPTDPFLLVQRLAPDGMAHDLHEVDDVVVPSGDKNHPLYRYPIHHADPSMLFTAPEEGLYRLLVRDLYSSQGDPRHAYRLRIDAPRPGFALIAFPYQSTLLQPRPNIDLVPKTPQILRGGTEPIFVHVLRRPGFSLSLIHI